MQISARFVNNCHYSVKHWHTLLVILIDEGEEEELLVPDEEEGYEPLNNPSALPSNNYIQSPEDIDDIDIEENVDYITS